MSDKHEQNERARQQEAHSIPPLPRFEYEILRVEHSGGNSTSGHSHEADPNLLETVSLQNFHG